MAEQLGLRGEFQALELDHWDLMSTACCSVQFCRCCQGNLKTRNSNLPFSFASSSFPGYVVFVAS